MDKFKVGDVVRLKGTSKYWKETEELRDADLQIVTEGIVIDMGGKYGVEFKRLDGSTAENAYTEVDLELVSEEEPKILPSLEGGAESKLKLNKYSREIKKGVYVDVYDVLNAFNVIDPCLQHMLKKCLANGVRGHKDATEDYKDILASAERALELHLEWKS